VTYEVKTSLLITNYEKKVTIPKYREEGISIRELNLGLHNLEFSSFSG